MKKRKSVIFKGNKNGITVLLDAKKPFEEVINAIKLKFQNAENFFGGAKMRVHFRGRELSDQEKQQISDMLVEIVGDDVTVDFRTNLFSQVRNADIFDGIEEGITKFHRGTVRSGQVLRAKGNLVVIGDVNPGAQVIANGNIVVMGSLRGTAHAGHNGNRKAVVVALKLQATQLRIADIIARSPDEDDRCLSLPELAYIHGKQIMIDYYLPKKNK